MIKEGAEITNKEGPGKTIVEGPGIGIEECSVIIILTRDNN